MLGGKTHPEGCGLYAYVPLCICNIVEIICEDIKFPLCNLGEILCGDIKFPLCNVREILWGGHKIPSPEEESIAISCLILLIQNSVIMPRFSLVPTKSWGGRLFHVIASHICNLVTRIIVSPPKKKSLLPPSEKSCMKPAIHVYTQCKLW